MSISDVYQTISKHAVRVFNQPISFDDLPSLARWTATVDPGSFNELYTLIEQHERRQDMRVSYDGANLAVKFLLTAVHETHVHFVHKIISALTQMAGGSARHGLISLGPVAVSIKGGLKQADTSLIPRSEASNSSMKPTVVIETGFFESKELLHASAHTWLTASDHKVLLVILIFVGPHEINSKQPQIVVEHWVLDGDTPKLSWTADWTTNVEDYSIPLAQMFGNNIPSVFTGSTLTVPAAVMQSWQGTVRTTWAQDMVR